MRGRTGIAWDRLLIYGTGGVAFAGFNTDFQLFGNDLNFAPFAATDSRSTTRAG